MASQDGGGADGNDVAGGSGNGPKRRGGRGRRTAQERASPVLKLPPCDPHALAGGPPEGFEVAMANADFNWIHMPPVKHVRTLWSQLWPGDLMLEVNHA